MDDINFSRLKDVVETKNEDGEFRIFTAANVATNLLYEYIPNTPIRYSFTTVNDIAFSTAGHASDQNFTERDGFELVFGIAGGLVGAFGGYGGSVAGAYYGEEIGGALYEELSQS